MIAMQGVYENGKIILSEKAPMDRAEVIVIFPEEDCIKRNYLTDDTAAKNKDDCTPCQGHFLI